MIWNMTTGTVNEREMTQEHGERRQRQVEGLDHDEERDPHDDAWEDVRQ
jgi:hypothetical protein